MANVITVQFKLTDTYTDKFGRKFTVADFIDDLSQENEDGEPTLSPAALLHHLALYGGSRKITLGRDGSRKAAGKPAARMYAPDLSEAKDGAVPAPVKAAVEAFRATVKPAPEAKPAKPAKESAKDRKIRENAARIAELEALFAAKVAAAPAPAAKVAPSAKSATPVESRPDLRVRTHDALGLPVPTPAPSAKGAARKAAKVATKEAAATAKGAPVIHRTDLTPATVATAPAAIPPKPAPKLPVTRTAKPDPKPTPTVDPSKVTVTASGLVITDNF